MKPLTNEAWKRLYSEQFGDEEEDNDDEEDAEEKPRKVLVNWREKYSDGLDRRLIQLTQTVNRLFLSSLANRRVFPMNRTMLKPTVVEVYPDDDEYDFDEDMWRNRHRKPAGKHYLRGRKFPQAVEDDWRSFPDY